MAAERFDEEEVARAFDLVISGRVQGVGFRQFVVTCARDAGLTGFVRNLPDGRVAIRAEGSEESLERLHEAVRRGPPGSRVTGVERSDADASGTFARFEIRF